MRVSFNLAGNFWIFWKYFFKNEFFYYCKTFYLARYNIDTGTFTCPVFDAAYWDDLGTFAFRKALGRLPATLFESQIESKWKTQSCNAPQTHCASRRNGGHFHCAPLRPDAA